MIPYKDDNPTSRRPIVTHALIAINIGVFILVFPWHQQAVWDYGFLPWELYTGLRHPESSALGGTAALFTSMFMHGGMLHLAGNMLFLWVFGDNVEDAMGRVRFVLFYLICGLAAHFFQFAFLWIKVGPPPLDPMPTAAILNGAIQSPTASWFVPMVGASGAISGIMASYYLLYPRARVRMLVPIFFILTTIVVPASFAIGYWFVLQLLSGLADPGVGGGVAWWAHIGGFVGGVACNKLFISPRVRAQLQLRKRWKQVNRD